MLRSDFRMPANNDNLDGDLFTPEDRERVRTRLLEQARGDPRISAAALFGSAARGEEDRWSDIDLTFGVRGAEPDEILEEWSEHLFREFEALHLFDVRSGTAVYRVFLLPGCLQVDLAFSREGEFGASGPSFHLLFGNSVERQPSPVLVRRQVIGLGAHHVLRARSCIERGKWWQAEHWITSLRNEALTLACLRLGKDPWYGRGVDLLPPEVLAPHGEALVRSLAPQELKRALRAATDAYLREVNLADPELAAGLDAASIREMAGFFSDDD